MTKYILSINMYAHEGSGFSTDHYEIYDSLDAAKIAADKMIRAQRWCNVITRDAKGVETIHYKAKKNTDIRVPCPSCLSILIVAESQNNMLVTCPKCGNKAILRKDN